MLISVLVATYGSREWRDRGDAAAASVQGADDLLHYHSPHESLAQVRNRAGFLAPRGMLCFLDGDDRLHTDFISTMRHKLRSRPVGMEGACAESSAQPVAKPDAAGENGIPGQEVGLTAGTAGLFVPSIQFMGTNDPPAIPAWDRNLLDVNCAVIGTLIHSDLFRELGGFRDQLADGTPLNSLEDWDLWLRAVRAGAIMVPVPEAIYLASVEDGGSGRRNTDQSPYNLIRNEHVDFPWDNIHRYKAAE